MDFINLTNAFRNAYEIEINRKIVNVFMEDKGTLVLPDASNQCFSPSARKSFIEKSNMSVLSLPRDNL
jgi:hypothetical protein